MVDLGSRSTTPQKGMKTTVSGLTRVGSLRLPDWSRRGHPQTMIGDSTWYDSILQTTESWHSKSSLFCIIIQLINLQSISCNIWFPFRLWLNEAVMWLSKPEYFDVRLTAVKSKSHWTPMASNTSANVFRLLRLVILWFLDAITNVCIILVYMDVILYFRSKIVEEKTHL